MGRPTENHPQRELPLFEPPTIVIPVIKLPQPDGSILIKPGKPVIVDPEISVTEAAKLLGLSPRHIESQCSAGHFKTAYKPGGRPRSKWKLARWEVMARRAPPAD